MNSSFCKAPCWIKRNKSKLSPQNKIICYCGHSCTSSWLSCANVIIFGQYVTVWSYNTNMCQKWPRKNAQESQELAQESQKLAQECARMRKNFFGPPKRPKITFFSILNPCPQPLYGILCGVSYFLLFQSAHKDSPAWHEKTSHQDMEILYGNAQTKAMWRDLCFFLGFLHPQVTGNVSHLGSTWYLKTRVHTRPPVPFQCRGATKRDDLFLKGTIYSHLDRPGNFTTLSQKHGPSHLFHFYYSPIDLVSVPL